MEIITLKKPNKPTEEEKEQNAHNKKNCKKQMFLL